MGIINHYEVLVGCNHPYFNKQVQANGRVSFVNQAGYQLKIGGIWEPRERL